MSGNSRHFFISFVLSLFLIADWAGAASKYFQQEVEFPNYFLPAEFRTLSAEKIPKEVVQEQKVLLENALASLQRRMTWEIYLPGKVQVQRVQLFSLLQAEAKTVDPAAKVMPSGGVIRSMLSYLYSEMRLRALESDAFDSTKFLRSFAANTTLINDWQVRGVGSDLDLLIDGSQKISEIKKKLLGVINYGLNRHSGDKERISQDRLGFVRAIFLQGDIKDYNSQTRRSSSEGGSSLDWLAFDSEIGKFKVPDRDPNLIERFIRGKYAYFAPTHSIPTDEHAGTVIRGIRPFLELPFLKMEGEEIFRKEIQEQLKLGHSIPFRDQSQVDKMVRNSVFGGANNRFYRVEPGSLDQVAFELLRRVKEVPIFISSESVALRTITADLPRGVVLDPKIFIANYTDKGVLYHGTKSQDSALSILRNGLYLSGKGQGSYALGSGAYSTLNHGYAVDFAKPNGLVLELKVREDLPLRILDWEAFEKVASPADKALDFTALSEKYQLDAIVKQKVTLIHNSEILDREYNSRFLDQVRMSYAQAIENRARLFEKELDNVGVPFSKLIASAESLSKEIPIKWEWVEKLFKRLGPKDILYKVLELYKNLPDQDQLRFPDILKKAFQNCPEGDRFYIWTLPPELVSQFLPEINTSFENSERRFYFYYNLYLNDRFLDHPEWINTILKKGGKTAVRAAAIRLRDAYGKPNPALLAAIIRSGDLDKDGEKVIAKLLKKPAYSESPYLRDLCGGSSPTWKCLSGSYRGVVDFCSTFFGKLVPR